MKILVVCVGNICRSPLLEEILRVKAKKMGLEDLHFASCGISEYQVGKAPHPIMCKIAAQKGYFIENHRAKQLEREYFEEYDLILAATRDVLEELLMLRELSNGRPKLLLSTSFSKEYCDIDIPDPYSKGEEGFQEVIAICEDAADGLLSWIAKHPTPHNKKT